MRMKTKNCRKLKFRTSKKTVVKEMVKKVTKLNPIKKDGEQLRTTHAKLSVLEHLKENLGIVDVACELTGISRTAYYNYLRDDPEFKKKVEEMEPDIESSRLTFVEGKLMDNIDQGNVTAQIFFLKTKGKHKGYVERSEVTGKDGQNIFDPEAKGKIDTMSAEQLIAIREIENNKELADQVIDMTEELK